MALFTRSRAPMPKEPMTYSQRYAILAGRTAYADYVRRQQAIQQGKAVDQEAFSPNNESSIMLSLREGEFATTAEELASYLEKASVAAPPDPTVPQAPLSLCVIPGDSELTIFFLQGSDGGSPITNYSYSTNGVTFIPFSPVQTTTPLTISGLTNGIVYTVYLKAINAIGASPASAAVTAAPIPNSFTPASIAGLNVWLDGQDATKVILTGSNVTAWNDNSSAANNFTAGGGTILYDLPSPINNRPALTFATASPTTSTYLANSFNITPGTNQLSLFMVLTQTNTGIGNSELFYTRTDYRYFDVFNNTNLNGLLSLNIGNDTQRISTVDIITTPPTIALISVLVSTTASLYVNGTVTAINGVSRGGLSLDAVLDWSISGGAFLGSVGEVITYPTAIADSDRQKVEAYLSWKWGLQDNLPSSNPWKSTPPTSDSPPGAPTLILILPGNGIAYVYYTAGTGTTTNYQYTTNAGTNYTEFSPIDTDSPNTIPGLTNGTPVTLNFRAYNGGGVGTISNSLSVTPSQPSVPTEWLLFDPNNTSSYSGLGSTVSNIGSFGALNGTITGAVTHATGTGISGKIFNFNGGHIAFPSFTFTSAFTISAWVKPSAKFSINTILANGFPNVNTAGFKFTWNSWQSSDGRLAFESGDGNPGNWYVPSASPNTVLMDQWQMLTVIFDRAGRSALFLVNGVPVSVGSITTAADVTITGQFNIGAYRGGTYSMKAELGLLKVFNSNLTASQVYDDFMATKAPFGL